MGYIYTIVSRFFGTALDAAGGHMTLSLSGILFLGFPVAMWGGAYGYAITTKQGIPPCLAIMVAIIVVAVFAMIFMFFYSRLSDDGFAVVTLAAMLAMEALLYSWDSVTGGVLGIAGVPRIVSGQTLGQVTWMIVAVSSFLLVLYWFLLRSPFGRSLRALKENKPALTTLGVSPVRTGQTAIFMACMFSGIMAVFSISRIQFLDPTFAGVPVLIQVLTIAILTRSPRLLQLIGMTLLVVLLPEVLRSIDLPVTILGHLRNLLYSTLLIVLLYYLVTSNSVKRYV
jgi:branched-chain amino acid transport system permease protein